MPPTMKLSPRYMTKSSSPRKSARDQDAWARPSGAVLRDVGDLQAERRAVADRVLDRGRRVADHDPDVGDAGLGDGLQTVEQDGLVGHRQQLLGRGVGDRPQPGA